MNRPSGKAALNIATLRFALQPLYILFCIWVIVYYICFLTTNVAQQKYLLQIEYKNDISSVKISLTLVLCVAGFVGYGSPV